jgi:hypothetical protein
LHRTKEVALEPGMQLPGQCQGFLDHVDPDDVVPLGPELGDVRGPGTTARIEAARARGQLEQLREGRVVPGKSRARGPRP